MRIFDLVIDGKAYKACCGLHALAELQKRYGTLTQFEGNLTGRREAEEKGGGGIVPDVDTVIYVAKLFLRAGNDAAGGPLSEEEIERIVHSSGDMFGTVGQLYRIYAASMYAEDQEEEEKNGRSQAKGK